MVSRFRAWTFGNARFREMLLWLQMYAETTSLAHFALYREPAPHRFSNLLHDSKPKTAALNLIGRYRRTAIKRIENLLQFIRTNAAAMVFNRNNDIVRKT